MPSAENEDGFDRYENPWSDWYPGRPDEYPATLPVHSHWVALDGEDIPKLSDEGRNRLIACAKKFRDGKPGINELFWMHSETFTNAFHFLLSFAGVEDHTQVVRSDVPFYLRFQIDSLELERVTGIQNDWMKWPQ